MSPANRVIGRTVATMLLLALCACAVQLVAPYNAPLQQNASSMQAEVGSWDLAMRGNAGTAAADPRNSAVIAMINKWRGEADAMLTLAVSNDPGTINCSDAAKSVYLAIEGHIPPELRASAQPPANAAASGVGCEATLVSTISTGLNDIERVLKYCQADWIPDAYFAALAQNRAATAQPPSAPTPAALNKLKLGCQDLFKPATQAPTASPAAMHGPAVTSLLITLQSIVYVENRKKLATAAK